MRLKYQHIIDYFRKVNWELLLFLVLVLNVKLVIKIPAILIFLFFNRSALRDKLIVRTKFIWFYLALIVIAAVNGILLFTSLPEHYLPAFAVGTVFWMACMAAAILNNWFVKKTDTESLNTTVDLFFLLNIIVTLAQLGWIMLDAGSINPYTYQGMHQKYFISTGDRMTGITFDVSTTNALINSFAVCFYLRKNRIIMALASMAVLLLTASNFTFLLLSVVLLYSFIFQSTRIQKSAIVICYAFLILFLAKISPQNNDYVSNAYKKITGTQSSGPVASGSNIRITERPDSLLSPEEKKQKIAVLYLDSIQRNLQLKQKGTELTASTNLTKKPTIPTPSIHTEPYQRKRDTTVLQKELLAFAGSALPYIDSSIIQTGKKKIPGKIIALKQTASFFKLHPLSMLLGTGMGNFSSKLAFRVTAMQTAGGYPAKYAYINDRFRFNHLELYLNYFTRDIEIHSVMNSPNDVYDQLISEYGIAGLIAFALLYVLWFVKRAAPTASGIPLLLLMLGAFTMDYWFEQLSVVILFELLMLINIKEKFGEVR